MRKTEILVILFFLTSLISHPQIIADHTIIDRWDDIPEYYINEVKKMLLIPAGESHTNGILGGLALLESLNPNYNYDQGDGVGGPDLYTTTKLRAERVFWGDFSNSTGWVTMYGEEDWFTNSIAVNRTKAGITYINEDYGTVISALGFGWCWDMFGASSTVIDPLYGCHWFGTTLNGQMSKALGLRCYRSAITGNSVSMDTYSVLLRIISIIAL